jgi:acetyltransferase
MKHLLSCGTPLRIDARFSMAVPLGEPARIVIRCIRAEDKNALREGFKYLSAETRYRRFHMPVAELTPPMLRYLTEVDGWDHFAIVAIVPSLLRSRSRIVGVARAIRLAEEEGRAAEVALVVADDMQRRGLGGMLVEVLVAAACERGVTSLRAQIHYADRTVRDLLAPHGIVHDWFDAGTRTLELRIRSAREARELDS